MSSFDAVQTAHWLRQAFIDLLMTDKGTKMTQPIDKLCFGKLTEVCYHWPNEVKRQVAVRQAAQATSGKERLLPCQSAAGKPQGQAWGARGSRALK
jgi:hypothetical protein